MEDAVLTRLIQALREEMKEISYAIRALECLAAGKPRRGRPPKFLAARKKRAGVGRLPLRAV